MAQDNETYYLFLFFKLSTTEPLGKVIKISVFTFQFKETKSVYPRQKRTMWVTKKKKKKKIERNWHNTETTRQVCYPANEQVDDRRESGVLCPRRQQSGKDWSTQD